MQQGLSLVGLGSGGQYTKELLAYPEVGHISLYGDACPKVTTLANLATEAQSRVGRYATLALNDLVDAPRGDAYVLGQAVLGDSDGIEVVFLQDLSGVYGCKLFFHMSSFPSGSP